MFINCKRLTFGAFLLSCMVLAAGCGSDNASAPTTPIAGKAIKGPISGADVYAYKLYTTGAADTAAIAHDTTKADGSYTLNVPAGTGAVIIKVVGNATATYADDNTGVSTSFPSTETLTTATIPDATSGKFPSNTAITPFTTMAANLAASYYTSGATKPQNLQAAITASNQAVSTLVGLDITNVNDPNYLGAMQVFKKYMDNTSQTPSQAIAAFVAAIQPGSTTLSALNTALATAAGAVGVAFPTLTPVTPPDFSDITAPTTPTALTLSSATSSTVVFSWTASTDGTGVAGYYVYRNGVEIGISKTTNYTDSTVAASTTYSYTVKAYDVSGNISAASTALSVTTPAAPTAGSLDITASGSVKP